MKKIYISFLALLIVSTNFGCAKKTDNLTVDSTKAGSADTIKAVKKNTMPHTTIVPATANNSVNMMVSPGGNNIIVSVYFIGSNNQTVTVKGIAGINPFQSNIPQVWNSTPIPGQSPNFSIVAADAGIPYNQVSTAPGQAGTGNPYGVNASTYSNGGGDMAIVIVQDAAVTTQ
jgi:hypothetical protein